MRGRWRHVEEIFQQAMDLPESRRTGFLDQHCASRSDLRRDVESLMAHAGGAETFFSARLTEACPRAGHRVGAYRLERQIGSGGMGAVYLASRDDGEFRQRVAIKLVRTDMSSSWALQRFRHERQVLSALSHVNIARLLDGGSTPEGVPYLAMEYIEGQSITSYCRERRLSVKGRLELFLGVCEAVSYAHRNLVVHRDIKPGNILVSAEGVPKLLDFGISKLLDPVRDGVGASTVVGAMTPEYASPEQIRGDAVTTAADVYSLGVVLYEILAGRCPTRSVDDTPAETEALNGDLANIAGMAMRIEPDRRYASVERMAEDIRRYLAGHPVMARKDTLGYRAGKFVRRHKVGVIAALLLVLSILGGTIATAWQVQRVAEQIFRAERRFMHFRKLANSFLFEFDDRIQKLRDLSEARQLVLETGIEYIDGLAREAGGDPMLVREVARAYEKFGDVQGFRHEAAMGDPADALVSYRKVLRLLEPLIQTGEDDPETLLLLSRSYCSAGSMIEYTTGNLTEALLYYRKGLDIARQVAAGRMDGTRYVGLLNRAYQLLGDAELASGNRAASLESYLSLQRILEMRQASLGTPAAVWLADTKRRIGRWETSRGNDAAALHSLQQALALVRKVRTAKHSYSASRELLSVYHDLLRHLLRMSRSGLFPLDPKPIAREMVALASTNARLFPRHPLVRDDLEVSLALETDALHMVKGRPE